MQFAKSEFPFSKTIQKFYNTGSINAESSNREGRNQGQRMVGEVMEVYILKGFLQFYMTGTYCISYMFNNVIRLVLDKNQTILLSVQCFIRTLVDHE